MAERARVSVKKPEAKRENRASQTQKIGPSQSISSPVEQILFLQRTIGNQAVGRLIQSGALQAKLRIGQPGDIYEQEADRVAEKVINQTYQPLTPNLRFDYEDRAMIKREAPAIQRQEMPEEEEILQTKGISGHKMEMASDLESQIHALRGGGQPLNESALTFFESRFGNDFSQVRVHTDNKAAKTASLVNARAFTMGKDVVFGSGQYAPENVQGKKLLAHELTHVIQQSQRNIAGFNRYKNLAYIQPKNKEPSTAKTKVEYEEIEIDVITFRKGDTARSIMQRALIKKFKLSLNEADKWIMNNLLELKITGGKPKPGDQVQVTLKVKQMEELQKITESQIEGKEGKEGGDGLGLIEVPRWVVKVLEVADVILTIVSLITGAGAIVVAIKVLAKKLLKWAIKRAIRKAAKEAAERIAKESLKEITKEATKEVIEKTIKEAVKKEIKKSAEKAAREALQKSMKGAIKEEIEKATKELAEEVSEEISKEVAREATKKLIIEATKKYGKEAVKKFGVQLLERASNLKKCLDPKNLEQIQKKWKHAKDFGINTPFKAKDTISHKQFADAINKVLSNSKEAYVGPYHNFKDAFHYIWNNKYVITDKYGNFISGWDITGTSKLAGLQQAAKLGKYMIVR